MYDDSMNTPGMLTSRHAFVESRGARRCSVELTCDVISASDERPQRHNVSCLSSSGLWINTFEPLHPGAEVVVSFTPPDTQGPELTLFARVVRVVTGRRKRDRGSIGMGLVFMDVADSEAAYVDGALACAA